MWRKHAHTLATIKKLCSNKANFTWTGGYQKDFIEMKKIVGRDMLLSYPNFSEEIIIHTEASRTHTRKVISQYRKSIVFCSRKLTPAEKNYTTI